MMRHPWWMCRQPIATPAPSSPNTYGGKEAIRPTEMSGDDDFRLPSLSDLNDELYHRIRETYGLKAQMAQSVMKTVLARYTTLLAQMRDSVKAVEAWERRRAELEAKGRRPNTKRPKAVGWTRINFHSLQCDMVLATT